MRILLYEYTTGGGLVGRAQGAELDALLPEGMAMISAVASDFAVSKHHVHVLRDARCRNLLAPGCEVVDVTRPGEDQYWLKRHCSTFDWTLLIAPETDGLLSAYCRLVRNSGGRLLGPALECIELTSDKHATVERLRAHGVPAPAGCAVEHGATLPLDFQYPAVLKPRDGCGSQGVQFVPNSDAARHVGMLACASRLEEFVPGVPFSVALLCGPAGHQALPACRQFIRQDGHFAYLGGSLPVPADFALRAQSLARHAIDALPGACGYVGVDLVLGEADDGSRDRVIEINPRLTTSYVGLRAACRGNLAQALLDVTAGGNPRLAWHVGTWEFTAAGEVHEGGPRP